MEVSNSYRDRILELYKKSRCGNKEAYHELEGLVSSTLHPSPEDELVAKGYLGDLLLICKSTLIPRNERRAKLLLSQLSHIDGGTLTCHHLQLLLAVYYEDCCIGMHTEAMELFQQSADQGHDIAMSTMAYFYDYGKGVRKDTKKAFGMYATSASRGYAVAQCNLGKCYDSGNGCEKSVSLAVEWYEKAANQGFGDALYNMGVFHQSGRVSGEANYEKSVYYFKLAAEQGDAAAQYNLAWCYHHGRGVGEDAQLAVHWCLLSAGSGDAMAAQFLGIAHEHGWGVEIDIVEAMRYYRQAVRDAEKQLEYAAQRVDALAADYKEAVS